MTMDFNERVIPGVSSNFMFKEALARYEFASRYVKPGMKILDLGCGTGYGDAVLLKRGVQVLGIDIDSEAIVFAKEKYGSENVKFQKENIFDLKLPKKSFDLVCSFEVIEHLKNPSKFLQNMGLLLKKDGIIILSTPNASVISPKGGVGSPYHIKEFNYRELSHLLSKQFPKVSILGQTKSEDAQRAWKDFLESQKVREAAVRSDKLGIRKLISKSLKEKIWKYLGGFFGRGTQETLDTKDFPIGLKSVRLAYYFVAVCQKSQ